MDQESPDAAAYASGRRFVCTHQMAALFSVKGCNGRQLQSMTSYPKSNSVDRQFATHSPTPEGWKAELT